MSSIIWISANQLGFELLKTAVELTGAPISGIVTLSSASNTVMYDSVERSEWDTFGLPVYEVDRLNGEEDLIRDLEPDLVVMCGWRQIVNESILDIPKLGFIGFHPTLLPVGRGPAPIINSILEGFDQSGVTMFYVGAGLDDGDIVGQEPFAIGTSDHASDVYQKVIVAGRILVQKYLSLLAEGNAPRVAQDESKKTVFKKIPPGFNQVDLKNDSIELIARKVRALSKPYRGAYVKSGDRKLVLWKCDLLDD